MNILQIGIIINLMVFIFGLGFVYKEQRQAQISCVKKCYPYTIDLKSQACVCNKHQEFR